MMIERILYNGNIITLDHSPPVSALAITGEKIIASGTDDEIAELVRRRL